MRYTTTKAAIGSRLSMRRALLLLHVAGAALLTIAVAGPARAQSTGIAACDDFLQKYDTCVTSKLPEAQRATYKAQLDQTRKMWVDMAKNPISEVDHGRDVQADDGRDEGLAAKFRLLVLT